MKKLGFVQRVADVRPLNGRARAGIPSSRSRRLPAESGPSHWSDPHQDLLATSYSSWVSSIRF